MLELDRPVSSTGLLHQGPGVMRFDVRLTGLFSGEHGEVVGDDGVEFLVLPIGTDLGFVSYSVSPQGS